jgi:putative Mn2+ efflux pump MntP
MNLFCLEFLGVLGVLAVQIDSSSGCLMHPLVVIGIALGLSMDAFAVAVACSLRLRHVTAGQVFRFGFHFGLFQALMPIAGWALGMGASRYIERWDHWIAFGLLALIGGKSIHEALKAPAEAPGAAAITMPDPTRGMSLIIFSVATSIDALAVGLSLAMLQVKILMPAAVIGVVTSAVTVAGMLLGSKLGARFGRKMEILGGLILIAIGLKILFSHLMA